MRLPVTGPAWYPPSRIQPQRQLQLHLNSTQLNSARQQRQKQAVCTTITWSYDSLSMHADVYFLLVLNILASLAWLMYPYTATNWMNGWLLEGAVSCPVYPTESTLTKLHWQNDPYRYEVQCFLIAEGIGRVRDRISRQPIICTVIQLGFFLLVKIIYFFCFLFINIALSHLPFWGCLCVTVVNKPTDHPASNNLNQLERRKEYFQWHLIIVSRQKTRYKHKERNKCMHVYVYFYSNPGLPRYYYTNHRTSSFDILCMKKKKKNHLISHLVPTIWKFIIMYISGRKSYLGSEI